MRARWQVVIGFVILTGCQPAQQALPTLMPTAPVEATATAAATARPTDDLAAIEAIGAAISPPIQEALEGLADLQGVRTVSAMRLGDGDYIAIDADIAAADDNEDTMGRILAAIQSRVERLKQVRVTSWVDDLPQRNWLWDSDEWTVVVINP